MILGYLLLVLVDFYLQIDQIVSFSQMVRGIADGRELSEDEQSAIKSWATKYTKVAAAHKAKFQG